MVRSQNLYINNSQRQKPYKLSRSRDDLFLQCPRCFYIDRKLGTDRPFGYPFTLNNAVDQLLKQEQVYNVLESNNIPQSSPNCTYCIYVEEFSSHDKK